MTRLALTLAPAAPTANTAYTPSTADATHGIPAIPTPPTTCCGSLPKANETRKVSGVWRRFGLWGCLCRHPCCGARWIQIEGT